MARIGVLAIFLCLGLILPAADAQSADVKCNAAANCKVAEAQAECQSFDLSGDHSIVKVTGRECLRRGASDAETGYFILRYKGLMSNGYETGWTVGDSFYYRNNCPSEPSYTGQGPWSSNGGSARSGSLGCRGGCDGMWNRNADSTLTWSPTGAICPEDEKKNCESPAMANAGYYWNFALNVCEPPKPQCEGGKNPNSLGQCAPEPCPDGMAQQQDGTCKKKDSECPAGEVRSPDGRCLPGDGQCAQGEVRGPDGTCKKDSDNDGQPDDPGEKDTFAGGDDCSMPPSCSGSPILCGQARIQWRIDCNTRKNRNIVGGSCAAMPVCTGEKCDAMEYAGLLMQWRTACAAEKLASQSNNNGGDGAQPEWTKVGGMSTDPGLGASPDDTKVLTVKRLGVEQLDQSGFGGGGSCIGFAVSGGSGIGSGFAQAMASPPDFFCNYIILIRAVIILSATVTCAFILTSGGKN